MTYLQGPFSIFIDLEEELTTSDEECIARARHFYSKSADLKLVYFHQKIQIWDCNWIIVHDRSSGYIQFIYEFWRKSFSRWGSYRANATFFKISAKLVRSTHILCLWYLCFRCEETSITTWWIKERTLHFCGKCANFLFIEFLPKSKFRNFCKISLHDTRYMPIQCKFHVQNEWSN